MIKPTKQEIVHFVQKRLKGVSFKADFWHGENIDMPRKKAQNNDVEWRLMVKWGFMVKIFLFEICLNFYKRDLSKTQ